MAGRSKICLMTNFCNGRLHCIAGVLLQDKTASSASANGEDDWKQVEAAMGRAWANAAGRCDQVRDAAKLTTPN